MTVQLESDLLRSFVAVADLENFTRAANVLEHDPFSLKHSQNLRCSFGIPVG